MAGDDEKADLNKLKRVFAEIGQLKAKYASEPEPINFEWYAKKLGAEEVMPIKEKFEAEKYSTPETVAQDFDLNWVDEEEPAMRKEAEEVLATTKAAIAELDEDIAQKTEARIGMHTTLGDIYKACTYLLLFHLLNSFFRSRPRTRNRRGNTQSPMGQGRLVTTYFFFSLVSTGRLFSFLEITTKINSSLSVSSTSFLALLLSSLHSYRCSLFIT